MNKHLKRLTASISALCMAATMCGAITASAATLYPKTVMTKTVTLWNKYANKNITLQCSTSKSDYQDYLYQPTRGIKVIDTVSTSRADFAKVGDVLKLHNDNYEKAQATQIALYNANKAYDYFKNLGYTYGDFSVALANTECDNAWLDTANETLFFGTGSRSQSTANSVKFLGSATDVFTHEYMHLITYRTLGWDNNDSVETKALMEAYSDIMAELADERGDWKVGATVFTNNSSSKNYCYRNLADPKNTKNPDGSGTSYQIHYGTWQKYKGHASSPNPEYAGSTVISHAAYLMHEKGYSNQTLAKIWMKSLSKYDKTSNFTFTDCREAFQEAAIEVLGQTGGRYYMTQVFDLMSAFDEVGVY